MIKADMQVEYESVTGVGNNLIFKNGGIKITIQDIDMTELLDEIRSTGYLKEYMEENLAYVEECLEDVREVV